MSGKQISDDLDGTYSAVASASAGCSSGVVVIEDGKLYGNDIAGEEPDRELRELQFLKNNYGPLGEPMLLRWRNGVFVPEPRAGTLERLAFEQKAAVVFLRLLDRFEGEGRNVSDKLTAPAYAPKVFAAEQTAKDAGLRKADLAGAMARLFEAGHIQFVDYGRPSRPYAKIARRPLP